MATTAHTSSTNKRASLAKRLDQLCRNYLAAHHARPLGDERLDNHESIAKGCLA
jgi:hypothetical protein